MWKSIVGKGYGKNVLEIESDFKDAFYKLQTVLDPILNHHHRTKVFESMLNDINSNLQTQECEV